MTVDHHAQMPPAARSASDSDSTWRIVKWLVAARDIAMAIGFFGALIGGGFIVYGDLRSKPSADEVHKAIDARAAPIESTIESLESDTADLKVKVDRVRAVQDYQLESEAWSSGVLEHIGSKAPGKAPPRPESLKTAERELMR